MIDESRVKGSEVMAKLCCLFYPRDLELFSFLCLTIPPRLGGSGCPKETKALLGLQKRVVVMMLTVRLDLVVLYGPSER